MYNFVKQQFKTSLLLHPILLLIFFLMHEINEGNSSEIKHTLVFIVIVTIISLLALWVNNLWNNNIFVSSYLLNILLIFFLFFRYIIDISGLRITILCIYFVIIYIVLFSLSNKLIRQYLRLNLFLNILFLLLTIIELAKFCLFSIERNKIIPIISNINELSKQNVYFLMLDGYAKNRNLKKYWNYDNSNFTNSLKEEGFYNIEDSYTNYNLTIETVTSMFTLEKVTPSASLSNMEEKQKNALKLENELRNNPIVVEKFQTNGYDFRNFFVTVINNVNSRQYPFASNSIYKNSLYQVVLQGIGWINSFFLLNSDLDRVEEVRKISKFQVNKKKPVFVYLHLMTTHFPYCLNEKQSFTYYDNPKFLGEYITSVTDNIKFNMPHERKILFMNWRLKYINHLKKINQLILPLVNSIKSNDKTAIIIVSSDHGSRVLCDIGFEEARKESFENISFVYFPDKNYSVLNQKMTPSELVRVIQMKCIEN